VLQCERSLCIMVDEGWDEHVCLACGKTRETRSFKVACDHCSRAFYCSEECKRGSVEHHAVDCRGVQVVKESLAGSCEEGLAPPVVSQLLLATSLFLRHPIDMQLACLKLKLYPRAEEPENDSCSTTSSCGADVYWSKHSKSWLSIMSLDTTPDQLQGDCDRQAAQLCATCRRVCATGECPELAPIGGMLVNACAAATAAGSAPLAREAQLIVAGLLYRDMCNGFGIWTTEYERLGCTLLPSVSMLNHSCQPNVCKVRCDDGQWGYKLVALVDIPAGEQLLLSYLPSNMTFEDRQKICSAYFCFACGCGLCSGAVADGTEGTLYDWQRHDCGGFVFPSGSLQICSVCQGQVSCKTVTSDARLDTVCD
jgi:hypothetical protein